MLAPAEVAAEENSPSTFPPLQMFSRVAHGVAGSKPRRVSFLRALPLARARLDVQAVLQVTEGDAVKALALASATIRH